jgi:hypothetical protein
MNRKYYEVQVTDSNDIKDFDIVHNAFHNLVKVVLNLSLLEEISIAKLQSLLPAAQKTSLVQYHKEKTIGYCHYNCDAIPKQFLKKYKKVHKKEFVKFPPQHLVQCLRSCPLFILIVDRSQATTFIDILEKH